MEKILYNCLLSGVGLDGKSFFYTNAMQVKDGFTHPDMEATRSGWFECSCCPTNLARLLPSIFKPVFEPGLLGGLTILQGTAVTGIPYYAWANRGRGEMTVWFPITKQ